MKKIAKILLPTDLSEISLAAMDYACLIAVRSRAHIYLLHIINEKTLASVSESCEMEESPLICACTLQQKLDEVFFSQLYRYENIACVIRRGNPSAQILKFADEEKIDLIIMTTHGRTFQSSAIIGTVADEVLHNAHLPIILVQPPKVQILMQEQKESQS